MQPSHYLVVWLVLLAGNQGCKPLVGCGGKCSYATRGVEHQWGKKAVSYFTDLVFVTPLLLLVPTVDRAKLQVSVRQCIGVEYPDIKKCVSVLVTPEALCQNVQMDSIISVAGGMEKRLCGQCLEWWLGAKIMACLRHSIGSEVPDLVISGGMEATHAAANEHHRYTCWGHLQLPAISEAQGVVEVTLVKGEPKFFYWEGG